MIKNTDNYCIILAGGKGRRLWPCSRDRYPKQFIDFFGSGRTQLQATFDRFSSILPVGNIFVCTNAEYVSILKEQLPEMDEANIVAEPVARNTAPSVAAATLHIYSRNAAARIIIAPSDQFVQNEEAFSDNVLRGLDLVAGRDMLLTMGVKPTRPEPGYGYIQVGEPVDGGSVYKVQSFTEKPEREFARMFVESGEFYWNTGMFLADVKALGHSLQRLFPDMLDFWEEENSGGKPWQTGISFINENYASFPNLSIDYGILERGENVCVMICNFGWADLGTWHSIYECKSHGEGDNVLINTEAILEDCRDNVIKLPEGKLAVINGLEGYIVAEKDNVLFICKKGDSSSLLRKYVNEVQIKYGEEFV